MSRALLATKQQHLPPSIKAFANLCELGERAKPNIPDQAYGYYASGAEGERTLKDNEEALARWKLLPRVLVDVSKVDTSCTVLGCQLSCPVLVAPMAMQMLAHPHGELAVARASTAAGSCMILSTMSTCSIEEVAEAAQLPQHAQRSTGRSTPQQAAVSVAGRAGAGGGLSSLEYGLSGGAAAEQAEAAAAAGAAAQGAGAWHAVPHATLPCGKKMGHLWFQARAPHRTYLDAGSPVHLAAGHYN